MTEPARDDGILNYAREKVEDDKRREGNGNAEPVALGEWNAGLDAEPPPPRGWLLGNSFCRRFISSVLGDGGVGKSALRILQALALATGRNLTGEHVFQRTCVLLVSFEDDANELRRRVRAARLYHDIPISELDGWLWLAAPSAAVGKLMTLNVKTGALMYGNLPAHIEAAVLKHNIGLVMLDPFVKTHGIPENANTEMDMVAQLLTDMAAKYDIAVDVPHHMHRRAGQPQSWPRGKRHQ
jgi:RecA-family ATPase